MAHDTIQWLKCVVHYLNMKMKVKSAEIINLQLCSSLKWEHVYKKGASWAGPCILWNRPLMPGIWTSTVLLNVLYTTRGFNKGPFIIIVVKLPRYKDGDVGNLRKPEYIILILDIHWHKEIRLTSDFYYLDQKWR